MGFLVFHAFQMLSCALRKKGGKPPSVSLLSFVFSRALFHLMGAELWFVGNNLVNVCVFLWGVECNRVEQPELLQKSLVE